MVQNELLGVVKNELCYIDSASTVFVAQVSDLVDEFYFEYYYYYDGLNFGWGKLEEERNTHNADSALRLMSELRRAGIRAHFWY